MKKMIVKLLYALSEYKRDKDVDTNPKYEEERISANIIRYVHAIEKGLSIEKPRIGFGVAKIEIISELVDKYISLNPSRNLCVYMARDVIKSYIEFHKDNVFDGLERIKDIYKKISSYVDNDGEIYGGIQVISLDEMDYEISQIEKLFKTRHSIRSFIKEHVSIKDIKKAVELAGYAPSACNRQAVRVYAIDSRKYIEDTDQCLDGIGGFANDVDKFLLITGKLSSYKDEYNQFIVSAGIFAGYLSLALHTYHIGACLVQRSLRTTSMWNKICEKNNIPKDEQLVCMIGIGKMKKKTTVPISKRFPVDDVFREIK